MSVVFLNGQFLSAEEARVSVFDRSFLYGDGLFETLRVHDGIPFRWEQHWQRLAKGAEILRIKMPIEGSDACSMVRELLNRNKAENALLRIHLSRGMGVRGYSTKGADSPTLLITVHDAPAWDTFLKWTLKTSAFRIQKNDPLASIKSANKLLHILARHEAEEAGFNEALILNASEEVAEGTSGNLFWIQGNSICTPPPDAGILPGITRAAILELCRGRFACEERAATLAELKRADSAFLTLSSYGLIEVGTLDEVRYRGSELTRKILQSYRELVALEVSRT